MSTNDCCRLCLTSDFETFIDIFDNQIELNIESIILIHFQLHVSITKYFICYMYKGLTECHSKKHNII